VVAVEVSPKPEANIQVGVIEKDALEREPGQGLDPLCKRELKLEELSSIDYDVRDEPSDGSLAGRRRSNSMA
jgi:hypothetical protein